jgi:hypothetical protein
MSAVANAHDDPVAGSDSERDGEAKRDLDSYPEPHTDADRNAYPDPDGDVDSNPLRHANRKSTTRDRLSEHLSGAHRSSDRD